MGTQQKNSSTPSSQDQSSERHPSSTAIEGDVFPSINTVQLVEISQHLRAAFRAAVPTYSLNDALEDKYWHTLDYPKFELAEEDEEKYIDFDSLKYHQYRQRPPVDPDVQRELLEMVQELLVCLLFEHPELLDDNPVGEEVEYARDGLKFLYRRILQPEKYRFKYDQWEEHRSHP